MKKPIKSYTEVAEFEGQKLEITMDIFDEPIFDIGNIVHTVVNITHHGKPWGQVYFSGKVEDSHLERTMKEIKQNLVGYKFKKNEFNKEPFSKN